MRVSVIGSGYVGLVAGACFSNTGNDVRVVDIDPNKIEALQRGEIPIYEPGLEEIVRANAKAGRLTFSTDTTDGVRDAQVVVMAVGTPSAADGAADLQYLDAAAEQVARGITAYTVIVIKSTVPVGTNQRLRKIVAAITDTPFDVVSNPEFLKEGAAVNDFLKPDRVVVGSTSERALKLMRHLYTPFLKRDGNLLIMDPTSAELTKYACNAMLATRISFMNELSALCEYYGADVLQIRKGMATDRRIGPDFLYASLGYGGSCFPKDVKALMTMGRAANQPFRIVESVDQANADQRERFFQRINHYFGDNLHGRKIGVWGLAFKASTDDVRDSAAVTVVQRLIGAGATVAVHDPKAMQTARELLGDSVVYCDQMYDAVEGADALVICTEWQVYRMPDLDRLANVMNGDVLFDGRNLFDLDYFEGSSIRYYSIGRPAVNPA